MTVLILAAMTGVMALAQDSNFFSANQPSQNSSGPPDGPATTCAALLLDSNLKSFRCGSLQECTLLDAATKQNKYVVLPWPAVSGFHAAVTCLPRNQPNRTGFPSNANLLEYVPQGGFLVPYRSVSDCPRGQAPKYFKFMHNYICRSEKGSRTNVTVEPAIPENYIPGSKGVCHPLNAPPISVDCGSGRYLICLDGITIGARDGSEVQSTVDGKPYVCSLTFSFPKPPSRLNCGYGYNPALNDTNWFCQKAVQAKKGEVTKGQFACLRDGNNWGSVNGEPLHCISPNGNCPASMGSWLANCLTTFNCNNCNQPLPKEFESKYNSTELASPADISVYPYLH